MSDMIIRSSQSGLAINNGPSVLGENAARIPVGGKIRSGIKVLTGAAKQHQNAQSIYDAGVAVGSPWDRIEQALVQQCGFTKSPLMPKNVPYFTVRRSDFKVPDVADRIMELYGEEVDGELRLTRFPVIFATDSWQANMPHALKSYTRSQLQFWSDYDAEGNRHCYTKQGVQVGGQGQNRRAHRPFGGRPVIPRKDNGGICDPDNCPEYQNRKCTLSGSLLFFIPGVPGSSAIELPTTSFYSLQQARQKMEMVSYLRGGRISGTHEGMPIFYLTKAEEEVSMIDPKTGEARRVKQFLVTLEADIDMLQVFKAAEQRQLAAGEAGGNAAAALTLNKDLPEDDLPGGEEQEPEFDDLPPAETNEREQIAQLRQDVADKLELTEIAPAAFSEWMVKRTGNKDWGKTLADITDANEALAEGLETGITEWKEQQGLDTPF